MWSEGAAPSPCFARLDDGDQHDNEERDGGNRDDVEGERVAHHHPGRGVDKESQPEGPRHAPHCPAERSAGLPGPVPLLGCRRGHEANGCGEVERAGPQQGQQDPKAHDPGDVALACHQQPRVGGHKAD